MAEHRASGSARPGPSPRPAPGPPPAVPEILELGAPERVRVRRALPAHQRWLRSGKRWVRTRRGRWTLATLACVAVILVGLLASGFLSSPAPPVDAAGPSLDPGSSLGPPAPSTPAPSKSPTRKGTAAVVTDPVSALKGSFPDNPLNHLHGAGLHDVTMTVTSADAPVVLGYLVPTGLGSVYGSVKNPPSRWTLSEQALGRGYLAAIFVQAGRTGAPVTCTVRVDGKVTNSETTTGAYGRAVCLG